MADTKRTLTELKALLADNGTKAINAQKLRDFLVSVYASMPVNEVTANTVITEDHGIVVVTANNVALTLPVAATVAGKILCIKKMSAATASLSIDRSGSDTIDGFTSFGLTQTYSYLILLATNGRWEILARDVIDGVFSRGTIWTLDKMEAPYSRMINRDWRMDSTAQQLDLSSATGAFAVNLTPRGRHGRLLLSVVATINDMGNPIEDLSLYMEILYTSIWTPGGYRYEVSSSPEQAYLHSGTLALTIVPSVDIGSPELIKLSLNFGSNTAYTGSRLFWNWDNQGN